MMKSHVYDPKKHIITPDWYVSEKLDGRYFFWDGGATRGMAVKDVPWANCIKDKQEFTSTGLWSSQGKVIHAPDNIAGQLPPVLLEGELWEGRGKFQSTMSKTKRYDGTKESWEGVTLMLFGAPTVKQFTSPRTIKYLAGDVVFNGLSIGCGINLQDINQKYFEGVVKYFSTLDCGSNVKTTSYKQIKNVMYELSCLDIKSALGMLLKTILDIQGEGLIIRAPWNYWRADRLHDILKIKPYKDAEGEIIGYMTGRETEKGSTLLGKVGAYVIRSRELGITFELSGMEHSLRELPLEAEQWAYENPCERLPDEYCDLLKDYEYAIGTQVTFRYRELSNDGVPKEARFIRFRED